MYPWFFHVFVDGVMKEVEVDMEKMGVRFQEEAIKIAQMDSLKDLSGITRLDRTPNLQIIAMCRGTKWIDERIDKIVLCLLGHI